MTVNSTSRNDNEQPFSFNIVKTIARLGEGRKKDDSVKELNYVSYMGGEPKWDIREWNAKHTKMSRGITLNDEELCDLYAAIGNLLQHEKPSANICPERPANSYNPWAAGEKAGTDAAGGRAEKAAEGSGGESTAPESGGEEKANAEEGFSEIDDFDLPGAGDKVDLATGEIKEDVA